MVRRIRLLLAMFTMVMMVGWTFVVMQLEYAHAWGDEPVNRVRYTFCALPYAWLAFNIVTCWQPNRFLCTFGLLVNLPAVLLAVAWFSQQGGIAPGYALLLYSAAWYAYAAKILRTSRPL